MIKKKYYEIKTYNELDSLIIKRKRKHSFTIVYIKNFLIKGFGVDWVRTMKNLANKKHKKHEIKFFVDCGYDFGLSILLIKENINFIRLKSNKVILNKIESIAKKNNVVLNPNFIIENKNY